MAAASRSGGLTFRASLNFLLDIYFHRRAPRTRMPGISSPGASNPRRRSRYMSGQSFAPSFALALVRFRSLLGRNSSWTKKSSPNHSRLWPAV